MRLSLLGAIDLSRSDGTAIRAVLGQPRRLALLAYLAMRAPGESTRRDSLLALFWPESDDEHARAALRNALHFLRRWLGPDVIESLGVEEVRLRPGAIRVDAVELVALLDAGRTAEALELYRGPFLDGFHVEGAPDFDLWLEEHRSRLHARILTAAQTLAEEAERQGDLRAVEAYARRLLTISPVNEAAARTLARALAARGDATGAVSALDEVAARIRATLELEPAPETLALAGRIRNERAVAEPIVEAVTPVSSHEAPPPPFPAIQSAPPPRPRSRTRRVAVAVAGVALVAVIVAITGARLRTIEVAGDPDMVAVLPFSYRGNPELNYLVSGLPGLVSSGLQGSGILNAVDGATVARRAGALPQPMDQPAARGVAASLGAGTFVTGDVIESGGRLRVTAVVNTPVRGLTSLTSRRSFVIEGSTDDLLEIADRITVRILEDRAPTGLARVAAGTTAHVDAVKPFLRGEADLLAGRRADALERFREAVAADSTFALAQYRLSTVAWSLAVPRTPVEAAEAAVRHGGRLDAADRALVEGWLAQLRGQLFVADSLFRFTLWRRPSHMEVRQQLGELVFHWGATLGYPVAESAPDFRYVLDTEPHNADAALHLARIEAREKNLAALESLATVVTAGQPDPTLAVELEALEAFSTNDVKAQDAAILRIAEFPGRDHSFLFNLSANTADLEGASRLARHLLALDRSPAQRAVIRAQLVLLLAAKGRFAAADSLLADPGTLPRSRALEFRAMLASLPWAPVNRDRLASIIAELEAEPDVPLAPPGSGGGPWIEVPHLLWRGLNRQVRLYLLGSLLARAGQHDRAHAVARTLDEDALGAADPAGPMAARSRHYAAVVRARVAWERGHAAEVLEALGPRTPLHPYRTYDSLVDHPRYFERFLRAEALRMLGRNDEAIRWYATFPDHTGRDIAFAANGHLARARIHDAAGDGERAAREYRHYLELWSGADPEAGSQLESARQRLAVLESGHAAREMN